MRKISLLLILCLLTTLWIALPEKVEAADKILYLDDEWVVDSYSGGGEERSVTYSLTIPRDGWLKLSMQNLTDLDRYIEISLSNGTEVIHDYKWYPERDSPTTAGWTNLAVPEGDYIVTIKYIRYRNDFASVRLKASFTPANSNDGTSNHYFDTAKVLNRNKTITGFLVYFKT